MQQLDGNVIGPKILGNRTGLSGFWVMFSIILFGGLWGIVGMVICVPLFAVIYDTILFAGLVQPGSAQTRDHTELWDDITGRKFTGIPDAGQRRKGEKYRKNMNYATIKNCDIANGPGVRVSLFVSGCTHHCKGCFNEVAWDFDYGEPFTQQTIETILDMLKPGLHPVA